MTCLFGTPSQQCAPQKLAFRWPPGPPGLAGRRAVTHNRGRPALGGTRALAARATSNGRRAGSPPHRITATLQWQNLDVPVPFSEGTCLPACPTPSMNSVAGGVACGREPCRLVWSVCRRASVCLGPGVFMFSVGQFCSSSSQSPFPVCIVHISRRPPIQVRSPISNKPPPNAGTYCCYLLYRAAASLLLRLCSVSSIYSGGPSKHP